MFEKNNVCRASLMCMPIADASILFSGLIVRRFLSGKGLLLALSAYLKHAPSTGLDARARVPNGRRGGRNRPQIASLSMAIAVIAPAIATGAAAPGDVKDKAAAHIPQQVEILSSKLPADAIAERGGSCTSPSAEALDRLRDHVATQRLIRVRWISSNGSDASAVARGEKGGRLIILTSLVDAIPNSSSGDAHLTDVQMFIDTSNWHLVHVSIRPMQTGKFLNEDPTHSKWRALWGDILGALTRATGVCVEEQLREYEKNE